MDAAEEASTLANHSDETDAIEDNAWGLHEAQRFRESNGSEGRGTPGGGVSPKPRGS